MLLFNWQFDMKTLDSDRWLARLIILSVRESLKSRYYSSPSFTSALLCQDSEAVMTQAHNMLKGCSIMSEVKVVLMYSAKTQKKQP